MTFAAQEKGIRRHSLLKRNPKHTPAFFSTYYENNHGPLAASLKGFRKHAVRYIQNHVEPLPNGLEPAFDGITMTTQQVRDDYYGDGFFKEPDYEVVKPDEIFLFDLSRTVSVLGQESVMVDGKKTSSKAILLRASAEGGDELPSGVTRAVNNSLDVAAVSALGFESSTFAFDRLIELWFENVDARDRAAALASRNPREIFLLVREVEIFGPDKPWRG